MSTYILGISAYYHDSAACLVKNGNIIAAAQEERFTRVKHDQRFPHNAIKYCLQEAGIGTEDITYVAFYDKPWLKFERILETYMAFAPTGLRSFNGAIPSWFREKLWIEELIKNELGIDKQVILAEHHQSHAASAFFPSPYEHAAILTIDGVGEWTTTSWGVGKGNSIETISEIRFPHSLGLLYSAFTYYLGFRVNSGEYKVMGLAPYGRPLYKELILKQLIHVKEDGSFHMNMKYFDYCQGSTMTNENFNELFKGTPRCPESPITQRDMDLARSVQEVIEEIILKMVRHIKKVTGERYLCLAGGVALNCVVNGKLLRENIFEGIWIQPAAGDAGGALGVALHVWHQHLGNPRTVWQEDSMKGSYLGPAYNTSQVVTQLKRVGAIGDVVDSTLLLDRTVDLLKTGKVVGWFQGRMEFGPRALGSRSILGDARNKDMQTIINSKIKYRESFRPFAPACLESDVSELFELEQPSPYMLLVAPVKAELPAITHVDHSARIQTVDGLYNRTFHNLLIRFKNRTGIGALVNTSFNVRGEPIVNTPEDAYRCFMNTEMDALVIGNMILLKEEQPPFKKETLQPDPPAAAVRLSLIPSFLFLTIITPVGLLLRFFGIDLLKMRMNNSKSYWL